MYIFGIYHSVSQAMKRAKLFANGRSQAVRLPKEFRFSGTEVFIERRGEEVVLSPVREVRTHKGENIETLGDLLDYIAAAGAVDESFERAIREARERDRRHPPRVRTW